MATVKIYKVDGTEAGVLDLLDEVFACKANDALLHQVFVAYAANRRQSTAHTKDRSERSGSGRKPWKQKGTGNARTGSIRNPIWRKGGVVFGPRSERNFTKKTTLKMRRKAMKIALSEKLRSNRIKVVKEFAFPDQKTKHFAAMLEALGIAGKSCLVVLGASEKETALLGRNIPKVMPRALDTLNAYDLLSKTYLLLSEGAIRDIQMRLADKVESGKNEEGSN